MAGGLPDPRTEPDLAGVRARRGKLPSVFEAALLERFGFTGAPQSIEGRRGFGGATDGAGPF